MNVVWQLVLIIMAINITYVSLTTVRFILMIKGLSLYASLLSVIEIFVYIMGLSIILNNLNSPCNIAAYCIGYGIGVFLGSLIEERLALGYLTAQVIIDSDDDTLVKVIRGQGFGVTSWIGDGRDGKRLVLDVLTKRNRQKELMTIIDEKSPHAFVVFHEPKTFKGGFWLCKMR
ncbi:UPF0316 protein [Syntrophobotulus glycolicus DSM 8271]|uniref:UPF0316 protein Sgly_2714 n=1 Tax=Syntrophobotulus glycolicus (strain DSM 8271 / FlGlyR) TaxID=645991 RepID=F0SXS6_SYNGF|nr:DUF2179 domain-containing protein [Syntrophobotulus glycolicus]ADY56987.1 UPF0316 protein [Syntrophobotulus glycolicus DSM 8271]